MLPYKKIYKASGSTTSDNTLAQGGVINETGTQVNNATKTMASMYLQMDSTKTILLIFLAGIAAYIFMNQNKK